MHRSTAERAAQPGKLANGLTYVAQFAATGTGVRPTFIGVGTIVAEAQRDGRYPLHRHQHYELIVPRRGAYRCTLNDRALSVTPSQCLLVQPGDQHADQIAAGGAHAALWFALAGAPLLARNADPRIQRNPGLDAALAQLIEQPDIPGDALVAHLRESLALVCVWRLIHAIPADARSATFTGESEDDAFRGAITRLFEVHADRPLTLKAMAAALHLGERTLTGHCRRVLNATPQQAFLAVRLARARALLAGTSLSVKEVAATCGFADQFHFSRVFKKHFGIPPSQHADR